MYVQAHWVAREITCCISNSHASSMLSLSLECYSNTGMEIVSEQQTLFIFIFFALWNLFVLQMAGLKHFVVLSQAVIVTFDDRALLFVYRFGKIIF